MFTGIIETTGRIIEITSMDENKTFTIQANFIAELILGQSIAHNGVCLTVSELGNDFYKGTAIAETLHRTTLNNWQVGQKINLERCLKMGDRLDGHLVQGHIDTVGKIIDIEKKEGSWVVKIVYPKSYSSLLIPKGSICVDGVSLTIVEVGRDYFSIALIPHTLQHTTFGNFSIGQEVNLEFDVIGKYVNRLKAVQ